MARSNVALAATANPFFMYRHFLSLPKCAGFTFQKKPKIKGLKTLQGQKKELAVLGADFHVHARRLDRARTHTFFSEKGKIDRLSSFLLGRCAALALFFFFLVTKRHQSIGEALPTDTCLSVALGKKA